MQWKLLNSLRLYVGLFCSSDRSAIRTFSLQEIGNSFLDRVSSHVLCPCSFQSMKVYCSDVPGLHEAQVKSHPADPKESLPSLLVRARTTFRRFAGWTHKIYLNWELVLGNFLKSCLSACLCHKHLQLLCGVPPSLLFILCPCRGACESSCSCCGKEQVRSCW